MEVTEQDSLLEEYVELLKQFNWSFLLIPDAGEERKARRELRLMWDLQKRLDPAGNLWRRYRPNYGPEPIQGLEV